MMYNPQCPELAEYRTMMYNRSEEILQQIKNQGFSKGLLAQYRLAYRQYAVANKIYWNNSSIYDDSNLTFELSNRLTYNQGE